MDKKTRLLYLGFAFPPGLSVLHPGVNPAGHGFETQMIAALRNQCEIRSVGSLPFRVRQLPAGAAPESGVAHELLLVDQFPELWCRTVSLLRLKEQYRRWYNSGWQPEAVLVYNLSPVYNAFIRWLRRRSKHPRLILLLLDSTQLGRHISPWKRFRRHLKPFAVPDSDMLEEFDGCIGLSNNVQPLFAGRQKPFLWMPGACTPARAPAPQVRPVDGPLRFCYFGSLGAHAGAMDMARVFLSLPGETELHICGYGRQAPEFVELAKASPKLKFHGLLPTPDDCLRLGQTCDVLINPRPQSHGNENNFASKLFDYGLCRRAIIASRISGTEQILGPEVFYFDPGNFETSLKASLTSAINTSREELRRRGAAIGDRIMNEFAWDSQARRMAEFIRRG